MQGLRVEHRAFGDPQSELLGRLLALAAERVPDDLVTVASGAAWTPVQLSGDTRCDLVEDAPASAQQCDLAIEISGVHRVLFEARGHEGEAPEVGRGHAD